MEFILKTLFKISFPLKGPMSKYSLSFKKGLRNKASTHEMEGMIDSDMLWNLYYFQQTE